MTDSITTDELLPCPFCGGVAELNDYTNKPVGAWVLSHKVNGCILRIVNSYPSSSHAQSEWNTRAIPIVPRLITAEAERDAAQAECARLDAENDRLREVARDMLDLEKWVSMSMVRLHGDIPYDQLGVIAEDVCGDWFGSGIGASFGAAAKQARTVLSTEGEQ